VALIRKSWLRFLGAGPQTPEFYRFTPNGTPQYITVNAMEDRATVRIDPSAMAGPYGMPGVSGDTGCLSTVPLGTTR